MTEELHEIIISFVSPARCNPLHKNILMRNISQLADRDTASNQIGKVILRSLS